MPHEVLPKWEQRVASCEFGEPCDRLYRIFWPANPIQSGSISEATARACRRSKKRVGSSNCWRRPEQRSAAQFYAEGLAEVLRLFLIHAAREMLVEDNFAGRQVILGLPAAATYIAHLRLPKMEGKAPRRGTGLGKRAAASCRSIQVTRCCVTWWRAKFSSSRSTREEIIVMACRARCCRGAFWAKPLEKARLDVVGMNVEIGAPSIASRRSIAAR